MNDLSNAAVAPAAPAPQGKAAGQAKAPQPYHFTFASQLATLADTQGLKAESFRALRTHLVAQHLSDGRRSLAVCAPSRGVGCTYIATNLAVSLARAGVKTLLIDGNMREPGVRDLIRCEPAPIGLYDYLSDSSIAASDAICRDVIPNLSVMYAGNATDNAQELLADTEFKSLIDGCLRDYDLTIVDTPPSNKYADAMRIATVLRYAMVVASRDMSFVSDVKKLVADLRSDRAQVIGTVMNIV